MCNRSITILFCYIVITGCGSVGHGLSQAGKCAGNGDECHVEGPAGSPGRDGRDGATGPRGPAGSQGEKGDTGSQGPIGSTGSTGPAGVSGTGCTVTPAINGALIDCTDGSSVLLLNGVDGRDGADAPQSAYDVVDLVDPCGDAPGIYDEIFLRLADGRLVASFSDNANGQNTRFSVLSPGNYMTTDGSHCYFSVNSSNQLYNEHY